MDLSNGPVVSTAPRLIAKPTGSATGRFTNPRRTTIAKITQLLPLFRRRDNGNCADLLVMPTSDAGRLRGKGSAPVRSA